MSNKDHLHLLTDDNGKPVAEKPESEIYATFNGKKIGRLQPLTMERINSLRRPYYNAPVQVSILDEGTVPVDFHNEYIGQWSPGMDDPRQRPVRVRTETIECAYPNILRMMEEQMHIYHERFGRRPQYFSLNRAAYRSFWLQFRRGDMRESHMINQETFMGIDVICNPYHDTKPVLALGRAQEEGIEGRLNYE